MPLSVIVNRLTAGYWAAGTALAALALQALVLPSDRRLDIRNAGLAAPHQLRTALRAGPIVAPVKRKLPTTPPWPQDLLEAGDIVPPVLAPDDAPLPGRKDALLAAAQRSAAAAKSARTTLAAQQPAHPARD